MTNPFGIINSEDQTIIYTSFNKVKDIFELNNNIKFTYGIDDTRKKMESLSAELIRYYSHFNFEQDENIDSEILAERNYIFSPSGLAAIYEIVNQVGTMYYIHTDHIGSLNVISDESGNLVQEMSYDAWGRRRNPNNWSYSGIPANYKFERGFTGHEHMDGNGLINMNGRMYDPILGRFLSSDPIVLYPDYSQDYNKYSYARNNPLVYYDPSGLYPIYNPNGEFWYDSEDYSIRYTIDEVNNWFEVVGMLVDAETATYLFTTINGEYGVSINGYFYTLFEMELKDLAFYEASLFEEDLGEMENWYYGLDATNGGGDYVGIYDMDGNLISSVSGNAPAKGMTPEYTKYPVSRITTVTDPSGKVIFSNTEYNYYPGIALFETSLMKPGYGITIPPLGIWVGKGTSLATKQHEYGHYLQYKSMGFGGFYGDVGFPSLYSAWKNSSYIHGQQWFERDANSRAHSFFGSYSNLGSWPK